MNPCRILSWWLALATSLMSVPLWAHDPIFGLGPHVLYRGGVEIAPEWHQEEAGKERQTELALELTYGLTGDWAAGIELPYVRNKDESNRSSGAGDIRLFTKYRFWRHDTLGAQESAALLLKLKRDSADEDKNPPLGSGSNDAIVGLA